MRPLALLLLLLGFCAVSTASPHPRRHGSLRRARSDPHESECEEALEHACGEDKEDKHACEHCVEHDANVTEACEGHEGEAEKEEFCENPNEKKEECERLLVHYCGEYKSAEESCETCTTIYKRNGTFEVCEEEEHEGGHPELGEAEEEEEDPIEEFCNEEFDFTPRFAWVTVCIVIGLIFVTIFFEAVKEQAEEFAGEEGEAIFNGLMGELTILGFIGLLSFIAVKAGLAKRLSIYLFNNNEAFTELLEDIHMTVFFVMVIFIAEVFIIIYLGKLNIKLWEYCESRLASDREHHKSSAQTMNESASNAPEQHELLDNGAVKTHRMELRKEYYELEESEKYHPDLTPLFKDFEALRVGDMRDKTKHPKRTSKQKDYGISRFTLRFDRLKMRFEHVARHNKSLSKAMKAFAKYPTFQLSTYFTLHQQDTFAEIVEVEKSVWAMVILLTALLRGGLVFGAMDRIRIFIAFGWLLMFCAWGLRRKLKHIINQLTPDWPPPKRTTKELLEAQQMDVATVSEMYGSSAHSINASGPNAPLLGVVALGAGGNSEADDQRLTKDVLKFLKTQSTGSDTLVNEHLLHKLIATVIDGEDADVESRKTMSANEDENIPPLSVQAAVAWAIHHAKDHGWNVQKKLEMSLDPYAHQTGMPGIVGRDGTRTTPSTDFLIPQMDFWQSLAEHAWHHLEHHPKYLMSHHLLGERRKIETYYGCSTDCSFESTDTSCSCGPCFKRESALAPTKHHELFWVPNLPFKACTELPHSKKGVNHHAFWSVTIKRDLVSLLLILNSIFLSIWVKEAQFTLYAEYKHESGGAFWGPVLGFWGLVMLPPFMTLFIFVPRTLLDYVMATCIEKLLTKDLMHKSVIMERKKLATNVILALESLAAQAQIFTLDQGVGDKPPKPISSKQREEYMESFSLYDKDESGAIDRDEFLGAMRDINPDNALPDMQVALGKTFDIMAGEDKEVDQDEFVDFLSRCPDTSDGTSEENLRMVFDMIDTVGNSMMAADIAADRLGRAATAPQEDETEGEISADELQGFLLHKCGPTLKTPLTKADIDAIMKDMDEDGSGTISFHEFVEFVEKHSDAAGH